MTDRIKSKFSSTDPLPDHRRIESELIEITARMAGIPSSELTLKTRPVIDLGIDSLDIIEYLSEIENTFDVTLPDAEQAPEQIYKQAFTRARSIEDLAELVQLRFGSGRPQRTGWFQRTPPVAPCAEPFTQSRGSSIAEPGVYERLGQHASGHRLLRRSRDGMLCLLIPGGSAQIGGNGDHVGEDEKPLHSVQLSPYLFDLELVSVAAYCRFLNAIGPLPEATLEHWFELAPGDRRRPHRTIQRERGRFVPRPDTDTWPVILVSWYGARAYAAWAHGADPLDEQGPCFLPSEAQWEATTRGFGQEFTDSDFDKLAPRLGAGQAAQALETGELPLRGVHQGEPQGPNGLRGALGEVWQWCADEYAPDAYAKHDATAVDPIELGGGGIRSERGGSWVGSAALCRPGYRRGRAAQTRGRCLGFRCAASQPNLGALWPLPGL